MRFAEGPSSTRSGHLSCIQRRCFSRGGARRCFTGLQSGMAAPVRADVAFRASAFSQRRQGRKISRSYRLGYRTRRSSNGARQPLRPPPLRPPPRHSRTGDSRSHGSRSRDTHLRGKPAPPRYAPPRTEPPRTATPPRGPRTAAPPRAAYRAGVTMSACAANPGAAKTSTASASGMTQQMATLKSALRAKFDQRIASSFVKPTLRAVFDPSRVQPQRDSVILCSGGRRGQFSLIRFGRTSDLQRSPGKARFRPFLPFGQQPLSPTATYPGKQVSWINVLAIEPRNQVFRSLRSTG